MGSLFVLFLAHDFQLFSRGKLIHDLIESRAVPGDILVRYDALDHCQIRIDAICERELECVHRLSGLSAVSVREELLFRRADERN